MSGYFILTLWTVLPLLLAYSLFKLGMPDDLVVIIAFVGFVIMIYWVLITTAIIIFGIQKYIELGNMDLFIQEFLNSIHD